MNNNEVNPETKIDPDASEAKKTKEPRGYRLNVIQTPRLRFFGHVPDPPFGIFS